jgi:hypothetical protein
MTTRSARSSVQSRAQIEETGAQILVTSFPHRLVSSPYKVFSAVTCEAALQSPSKLLFPYHPCPNPLPHPPASREGSTFPPRSSPSLQSSTETLHKPNKRSPHCAQHLRTTSPHSVFLARGPFTSNSRTPPPPLHDLIQVLPPSSLHSTKSELSTNASFPTESSHHGARIQT